METTWILWPPLLQVPQYLMKANEEPSPDAKDWQAPDPGWSLGNHLQVMRVVPHQTHSWWFLERLRTSTNTEFQPYLHEGLNLFQFKMCAFLNWTVLPSAFICHVYLSPHILTWLYSASHNRIPNWFQWGYRDTVQWSGTKIHKLSGKVCLPIARDAWSCIWVKVRTLLSGPVTKSTGPK